MSNTVYKTYYLGNCVKKALEENKNNELVKMYINHIASAIDNAYKGISKIDNKTEQGKEILNHQGMSGKKTRHLYNNLLSCKIHNGVEIKMPKYLEIGVWYGSSSISGIYKNDVNGYFIDNWSQFGGDKKVFINNITKYLTKESECYFLEGDCWKINRDKLGKNFNIYLYDGPHTEEDHYKAIDYYYDNMSELFIMIVDDWMWKEVRDGTMRAIKEKNLKIKFMYEIFLSPEELEGMVYHKGRETWWNGCAVMLLEK